jgi:phospholipid/cholesterol/gamma-HCH transport system substrate-binding protein
MNIFAEHDKRFEGLERRTGLFLAVAGLIVAAAVATALVKHDVFTQTIQVYFFADSAQGISKGMAVQLSGFRIGTVGDVALEPNAKVKARLVINSSYTNLIPQDSEARLAKTGLIGASFIEIVPGTRQARPVPNNGVLKFDRAGDFNDMAEQLTAKIAPILDDLKKLTASINEPGGDIHQTIVNVRQASAMLVELSQRISQLAAGGEKKIDPLLARADKAIEQTTDTIGKAGAAIDTIGGTLAMLDKKLPEMLLRLDQSLKNVEAVTADAKRLSSSLADELPPVVKEARALAEDAREIVDGAKRAWPIRNLVPAPQEKSLPLDSYEVNPPPQR